MNPSRWTVECSRIYQLTPAALRVLTVTLLCVCVGQPMQAQGFLKKVQKATRSVQEGVQKADSALSKADQATDAVECLADDANCVEKVNAEAQPPAAADSSGGAFPSSTGSAMVPGQCEIGLRAPPDTSGS
jgi:hypothetical protein